MRKHGIAALWIAVLCALAGSTRAQEVEPNDTCPGQHVGMPTLPAAVPGSLDTPPDDPDVDFFRFDFIPGDELVADLEGAATRAGTLQDPVMGLFDSDCNLIAADDDGGGELNSRLSFIVPDDGVVILAAASYSDFGFEGNGFSSGSYRLSITNAPPLIHSITGRLVDARDGQPLTGDAPAFASVSLLRCESGECREVALEVPDAQGRFTFGGALYRLRVGEYQLAASATGYQDGQQRVSGTFRVAAAEQYDFGDLPLQPDELQITSVQLCDAVPAEGGVCAYSLELRNRGSEPFSGRVWSLIDYGLPESGISYAFQVGTGNSHTPRPEYVWVEPEAVRRVTFHLRIPPDWSALDADGFACISAGIGRAPFAVHNVSAGVFIGCLTRAAEGLEWMPPSEVRSQQKAAGKSISLQGVRPKPDRRLQR